MKEDYLNLNLVIMNSIKKLTDDQIKNLIEGTGHLVYHENKPIEEKIFVNKEIINECTHSISYFHNKEEALSYLNNLKKQELIDLASYYEIRLLKSDSKARIINKIIDLVLGVKLRKKMFEDIKLHNK